MFCISLKLRLFLTLTLVYHILTHGGVPDGSVEQLAGVDKHHGEGGAGSHLAHQGQGHPHPEIRLGDKALAEKMLKPVSYES